MIERKRCGEEEHPNCTEDGCGRCTCLLVSGYARGNPIVTSDGQTWVYADGGPFDESRPCTKCGVVIPDVDLPDACLGWLPGVAFACCGHGVPGEEYVKTEDGVLYASVAQWRAAEAS